MSEISTFETSDFADPYLSFWSSDDVPLSLTLFLWKKLLRNMKQMISCFLSNKFFPAFSLAKKQKANN